MKRRLLLSSVLLLALGTLFAGRFRLGVEGGYSYTIMFATSHDPKITFRGGHGFEVSVPVEYSIHDWLSVDSGVRYMMKVHGFRNGNVSNTDDENMNFMHHYIEFPLSVRLSAGTGFFRGFFGLGGYLGVKVAQTASGSSVTILDETYTFSNVSMEITGNRFDAGLLAEAGVLMNFDIGTLYLSGRYQFALTSLVKQQINANHQTLHNISASLGFLFNIGGEV